MPCGVVLGDAAGFLEELLVVAQRNEPRPQFVVIIDRPGRAERHQIARLLEFLVIGTERHRKSERCGLQRVVDAHTESAADVAPRRIAVYRRQNADRVEDQQLFRTVVRVRGALGIAQRAAFGLGRKTCHAAFVHFVRRDDEFDVGIVVYQADQQLLVRTPRRAGHEDPLVALEPLDHVDVLGGLGDLGDTVEARVARYDHVVEAQPRQQSLRLLVLYEHHVERLQRLPPHAAVGAEEDRVAAEDGRDDIGAHLAAAQFVEQVEPEFVFHEDGDFWMRRVEEPARVAQCVDRQVEDVIHALIVLADLVTRRREEREQDFVFGMLLADAFDDGPSLFEFAERSHVYPDDTGRGVDGFGHPFIEVLAAVDP